MTTKPMPLHVLRTLRKRCGLSQAKLAGMVGASLTAIKQIETGRLRPSPMLAHRVYMQTGLSPDQLLENSFPETPFHAMGMEITKETFQATQKHHQESQTQEQVDQSLRHFEAALRVLLDAGTREGKLWALRPALQNAITKIIGDFGLEEDFARLLLAYYGVKDPWAVAGLADNLYVIVNGESFTKQRKKAEAERLKVYERQALKLGQSNGKHELQRNNRRVA
jgi:DNA-binding XRE family transcriptional regulator